jgi:hypothetical protein
MYRVLMLALIAAIFLVSGANASVVWSFGGAPGTVAQGTAYFMAGAGGGTITVYAEQVNVATGAIVAPVMNGTSSTLSGLFRVDTSVNNNGTGIAPYNPSEGSGSAMANQDGIEDNVAHTNPSGGQYSNILELQLGNDIAMGTTLSFLLQGPATDPIAPFGTTGVNVYYGNFSAPTNLNAIGMNVLNNPLTHNPSTTDPITGISTTGTTPQFSITKTIAGTEFIAIQADCHYLLLDTIKGTPASTPEPRFYGLLLVSLLGLAGIVYRKRQATA